MVAWHFVPRWFEFCQLLLVVSVDSIVAITGKFTYSRRPHEHSHDEVPADPALILVAVLSMYTPLSSTRHKALVPQLPLNYALVEIDTRHHLLTHFTGTHRLHNVFELDAIANVLPLLHVSLMALQLNRGTPVHLKLTTSVDWTVL